MKHERRCPKCAGRKLWWIERLRHMDKSQTQFLHRPIQLALGRELSEKPQQDFWSRVWEGSKTHYSAGLVDAYVCAACGYTELYAHDLEALQHNPEDGVHFIDASPEQGQFR